MPLQVGKADPDEWCDPRPHSIVLWKGQKWSQSFLAMWLTQTPASSTQIGSSFSSQGPQQCSLACTAPRPTKASQTCSSQPSDVSALGPLQGQVTLSWSLQPCFSLCAYITHKEDTSPDLFDQLISGHFQEPCKIALPTMWLCHLFLLQVISSNPKCP